VSRRRVWKFSEGGAALFLCLLFAPFLARIFYWVLDQLESNLGMSLFMLACGGGLAALIWWLGVRPLLAKRLWRIPRTWYEAGYALAAVFTVYAVFVFVTGHTPTRYGSHPIAREAGFYWLLIALLPLAIGAGAHLWERRSDA
jgi:hypothetical protein